MEKKREESTRGFTLSVAKVCGQASNRYYPDGMAIRDTDDMAGAAKLDHVAGIFKGNRRSRGNFISSDCIVMDCDNGHGETASEWITPADLALALPDVGLAIVPSRNNMKKKDSKKARPRFHVYFPIEPIEDEKEYAALKRKVQRAFPFFDANAVDAARFIFGNQGITPSDVIWQDGAYTIQEYLFFSEDEEPTISEGNRNSALSRFAGCVLKRFGNSQLSHIRTGHRSVSLRSKREEYVGTCGKAVLRTA